MRTRGRCFLFLSLLLAGSVAAGCEEKNDEDCRATGTCVEGPYGHVWPSDVGVTIGVGVTGAVPTEAYTGDTTIEQEGTVIDSVVIDGCLDIYADNVTVQNSIITCGGLYPIDIRASGATVINNRIVCTSTTKLFLMSDPVDTLIARNELEGCEDFFYINGDVDGLVVEDNYMHTIVGTPDSHADGFQIAEASDTFGTMIIRGNYIDKNNTESGATDILFATNDSRQTVIIESNFLHPWGHYTLRCTEGAHCIARYNVYSLDFLDPAHTDRRFSDGGMDEFACNRMEDGSFLDDDRTGVTNDTADCPDMP